MYIVPNKIVLDILALSLCKHSFFNPPDWLPTFEFDNNFVGIDGLSQIKEDMALNGVACKIERFISLYERTWHIIKDIN